MNKKTKILVFILVLTVSIGAFAQAPDLTSLQKGVANFSNDMAKSLPFNSSLGLNWSTAHIGKLPHFGIGGSFGFTTMEMPVLKELANILGYNIPFNTGRMILPAYAAEARLGGLFLPFDVGVKFGYLNIDKLWGKGIGTNYLLLGGDLRYSLLDLKLIKLSLGLGVNHLNGGVGFSVGSDQSFSYYDGTTDQTLNLSAPKVEFNWKTTTLDFKAQASLSVLILTPYIGVGGSYAWSEAGYAVKSKITQNGIEIGDAEIDEIKAYLKDAKVKGIDKISANGIESMIANSGFAFRTFGGLSINVAVFRIDLTGLYNFMDQNFGASLGLRFQL